MSNTNVKCLSAASLCLLRLSASLSLLRAYKRNVINGYYPLVEQEFLTQW